MPVRLARAHPFAAMLAGLTALSVISLTISLLMMREFQSLGVFYLDDTLFNSDPRSMLDTFAHGARSTSIAYPELRNSIHPYLWLYFGPCIRLISNVAVALGLTDASELQLRIALGVFVVPLVSAVQTMVFGLLLHALGFPLRYVFLLSGLNVVAFSNLIFDAVPEHFAITNLIVTGMLTVAVLSLRFGKLHSLKVWIPLGLIGTGITITNVFFLGVAHAATSLFRRRVSVVAELGKSAILTLSVACVVLASAYALGRVIDGPLERGSVRDNFVPRYIQSDPVSWQGLLRAAAALGNAIAPDWSSVRAAPPTPVPPPYDPRLAAPFSEPPYPKYTLEPAPGSRPGMSALGILALAGMAAGALMLIQANALQRLAAVISLSLIAFNLALHVVWGDEFFLYSQHWMTPSLILLSGFLLAPPRLRRAAEGGLVIFLFAVAWNNLSVVENLLAALRVAASANS